MPGRTVSTQVSLLTPSIPSGSLSAPVPGAGPTNVNAVVVVGERLPEGGLVALLRNGKIAIVSPTKSNGRRKERGEFFITVLRLKCRLNGGYNFIREASLGWSGALKNRLQLRSSFPHRAIRDSPALR